MATHIVSINVTGHYDDPSISVQPRALVLKAKDELLLTLESTSLGLEFLGNDRSFHWRDDEAPGGVTYAENNTMTVVKATATKAFTLLPKFKVEGDTGEKKTLEAPYVLVITSDDHELEQPSILNDVAIDTSLMFTYTKVWQAEKSGGVTESAGEGLLEITLRDGKSASILFHLTPPSGVNSDLIFARSSNDSVPTWWFVGKGPKNDKPSDYYTDLPMPSNWHVQRLTDRLFWMQGSNTSTASSDRYHYFRIVLQKNIDQNHSLVTSPDPTIVDKGFTGGGETDSK